jgi:hypothetical protein
MSHARRTASRFHRHRTKTRTFPLSRTKKSRLAASSVTRRAAPAKRIALWFVNCPQVHSRCGKKLIAVAAGGSHRFSRTAPLTQSRNGPGKVATLPCGARGFAVLCEASRCRQSLAALELGHQSELKKCPLWANSGNFALSAFLPLSF